MSYLKKRITYGSLKYLKLHQNVPVGISPSQFNGIVAFYECHPGYSDIQVAMKPFQTEIFSEWSLNRNINDHL